MRSGDQLPARRDLPSGTVTFLFTDVEGSTRLLREPLLGDMPDFEVGGRYLVTAAESTINACNYTLDYDADEAAEWAAAFEG